MDKVDTAPRPLREMQSALSLEQFYTRLRLDAKRKSSKRLFSGPQLKRVAGRHPGHEFYAWVDDLPFVLKGAKHNHDAVAVESA